MLNWKTAESTEQPLEFEKTASGVILRKDITTTERDDVTYYTYQEVRLSTEEYEAYLAETQAPTVVEIMQMLSDIQADIALLG